MIRIICQGLVFTFFIMLLSCGSDEKKKVKVYATDTLKKEFQNVNKSLVKTEETEINDFISRYGWNMSETGSGLKYMIYKKGAGAKISKGDLVKVNFETRLITGDLCYSSKTDGSKELLVGNSGEISGLEEGVMLLRVGDKAKLIIPSHLAFGLLGDENKIPKRATLVYDVEISEKK